MCCCFRWTCSFLALLILSVSPGAVARDEVLLSLEDYPNARAVFQTREYSENYILAMSSYRKIGGDWGAERQRRLSGQLSRRTLELPANHSAIDAYRFYQKQLQELTLRELFACQGRECGPSNSWANNHFGVIQLYGQDQNQYYGAYEVISPDQQRYYISLYTVLRGNRRVYVQVDILRPDGEEYAAVASADTLYKLLRSEGYFVVAGFAVSGSGDQLVLEIAPAAVESLVALLREHADLRVALVGHDDGATDLAHQRKQSLGYAEYLKTILTEKGVNAGRLETFGLGSLAPAGRREASARVEVVLLPRS